jgi:catechol 2,3-dioxygenase-like lactoylglutathione lyase family enzyme
MNPDDFPAPKEGFVITHVLVVADQEIRAYLRDPDGHLIEVGQVTGLLS